MFHEKLKEDGTALWECVILNLKDSIFLKKLFRCLKDNFQSALRTLESLFAFFVLFHVRRHKMKTFRNYLHEVN